MTIVFERVENILGKGKIDGNKQLVHFPCFLPYLPHILSLGPYKPVAGNCFQFLI